MTITEGLLIVIVIVLTFCILCKGKAQHHHRGHVSAGGCGTRAAAPADKESFTIPTPLGNTSACAPCDSDGQFDFATAEYGAEGMDFKDWATSQAIDASTVNNHADFVADRMKRHNTGRTWSPEQRAEMETTPAVPWQGLRRPMHVPVNGLMAQVNEYNENDYDRTASLVWRSGRS